MHVKVYAIDSSNIDTIIPKLQVSSVVIEDVRNAINAGSVVLMPGVSMSHAGWSGESYIALDAQGNGAYMLSSGEAGGRIALSMASAFPPVEKPDIKGLQDSFQAWLSKKGISYAKLINACPFSICGNGDTACNNPLNLKQQQLQLSSVINLFLGFIVSDAEAICLIDDLTLALLITLSVLAVILSRMGADIYTDSKSRDSNYPDDNYCKDIWISDTAWCDNECKGTNNIGCHQRALDDYRRCLWSEPRLGRWCGD